VRAVDVVGMNCFQNSKGRIKKKDIFDEEIYFPK
jgi:hypothetical protein